MVNGGELLARSLESAGVTDIFALHGGHLDSFWAACAGSNLRLVDTRHEAAAGNAADGYARTTGRLGVAVVTSGPGFANGFAALPNALADGVPMLMIASAPPLRELETNEMQGGLDQVAAAAPVTKWAHRVVTTERIPDLVALAIRKALTGRPGPVFLEIPIDVLVTPVDDAAVRVGGVAVVDDRPAPSPTAVADALEQLRTAQRPAIVIGGGTLWSDCGDELAKFADHTGIPVFANNRAAGVLPAEHRCNAWAVDNLAVLAMAVTPGPDVVMLLGARTGLLTGGRANSMVPADATVIQVDLDASEFGRLRPVEVPVVADCREFLRSLLDADTQWPDRSEWLTQATSAQAMVDELYAAVPTVDDGRLHPYHAGRESVKAAGPGSVLVLDGGEAPLWAGMSLSAAAPHRALNLGYMGYLGIGQGFAIGAQIAEPERRVLQLTGDGAYGFHIQELDTMVRHGLPIVTVVLNNACWGMSIHGQEAVYGAGSDVITRLADTDYHEVAKAFGGYGEKVTELEEIAPAIERAFASGKPACINVAVSGAAVHPLTTMMLGDLDVEDAVVVPYYESIPIPGARG
ncbi:thiamine pyrophosphate-binding protein [Mycolicibacterium chitae]|uniref:acetolactate synthase n=2 Tax=Mycolicibacterium TaxID=1866885 RepID=A0A3S4RMV2_MYCCI|nr:thiamine pyrophosphate-binding protein [Mycolicibacterium chitae]VEG48110.1 thiamine pyrophosphate binding domain-containing protein [Mycolicibacterium chitae]